MNKRELSAFAKTNIRPIPEKEMQEAYDRNWIRLEESLKHLERATMAQAMNCVGRREPRNGCPMVKNLIQRLTAQRFIARPGVLSATTSYNAGE